MMCEYDVWLCVQVAKSEVSQREMLLCVEMAPGKAIKRIVWLCVLKESKSHVWIRLQVRKKNDF